MCAKFPWEHYVCETCELQRSSYFSAFEQSYYLFILSWTQTKNSLFSKSNARRQFPEQPLKRFGWGELWSQITQNSALLVCHWGTHNLPFITLVDIITLFFNLTNSRVMDVHYNHRKEKKMLAHRKSKHLSWSFDKICGLISEGKRCNLYFFSLISEFWKHKVKRVNTDRDRRRIFSCPFLNCLQL